MSITSPTPATPALPRAVPAQTPPSNILIVDDTKVNRSILRSILTRAGHELREASNGREAIEAVAERSPDLILLDIMMPEMDGHEACERLKADPATQHVPVIFLSALDRAEDRIRGLELGAADYITKPFDRGEVLARVRTQLLLHHTTQQLRQRQKEMERELEAAADVQQALLPEKEPALSGGSLHWFFQPCDSLGGDMIGVQKLSEHEQGVYVFDVSGHGVPSALVTTSVVQFLSPGTGVAVTEDGRARAPAEVLTALDEAFPIERFSKHLTIAYLVLDTRTGEVRYSGAAHPFPVVVRSDGKLQTLEEGGSVIGLGGLLPFEEGVVQLEPGDRIFIYTDGIGEYEDVDRNQFGDERLHQFLARTIHDPVEEMHRDLMHEIEGFARGASANDDVTFLTLQWNGPIE